VTDIKHVYYEVGTTLLAKPQALCDLVELEGASTCLVFCNSPSDADFADVILKKRGLTSTKLIGYVPQLKLSKAIQQIQKKEVMTLVLTDVAARGVPLEEFDVVVNYSIPTDPEVYFHRYSGDAGGQTKKVVSLVAPLDIANFHYLKKLGKLEFVQESLPSPEQLFVTKYSQLQSQALPPS
jgi:superfamily II DNA/RNA helicase